MKTDIYTKSILTVIAFGLLLIGMDTFVPTTVADSFNSRYEISSSCIGEGRNRCFVYVVDQQERAVRLYKHDINFKHNFKDISRVEFHKKWAIN